MDRQGRQITWIVYSGVGNVYYGDGRRESPEKSRLLNRLPPSPLVRVSRDVAASKGAEFESPREGAFPATRWSMVLDAGADTERRAHAALETLCESYWYPIYSFVRRQGRSHHEAEDLTQHFLAKLLESEGIASARPERGRFRTFLLISLRNFMTDEWRMANSAKRGGGQVPLSLDLSRADQRFASEPSARDLTPDAAFDRNWALELIERSFSKLRADYESTGRGPLFAVLAPNLWHDAVAGPDDVSPKLPGMNAHALSMALNRLRHRLGSCLRAEVAETLADGVDVDAELRQLIAATGDASPETTILMAKPKVPSFDGK